MVESDYMSSMDEMIGIIDDRYDIYDRYDTMWI